MELCHKIGVGADLFVGHAGGDVGDRDGDVTIRLQDTSVDMLNELLHMVTNFFLALHRWNVYFFEHKSETRQTALGFFALCTHVFLCHDSVLKFLGKLIIILNKPLLLKPLNTPDCKELRKIPLYLYSFN